MLPNNMHNSQVISDSEMLDEYSNSSGGDIDAADASSGDEAQTSGVVMEIKSLLSLVSRWIMQRLHPMFETGS